MKNVPIMECLIEYLEGQPFSGHTPGHKGGQIIPTILKEKWPQEIWQYDLTEIDNLDNLHYPQGCIKDAQDLTARLFNAKSSYFLVNGTSVGIQAAILALAYNSPIFVPRNVHKSVYNGLILANAEPIYLPVTYDENLGIPLGIEPKVLQEWIKKYPRCKILMLTHPTYQGISYKIKEIMSVALAHGLTVIVDEAHGSHLAFHKNFPPTALSLGAHIVTQSWHKTLPVLTQASVLHLGKDYSGPDISSYLNTLQTTSPSYLLLASLDSCRAFLAEGIGKSIEEKVKKINLFKKDVSSLNNIKIYQSLSEFLQDPFKICLISRKMSGYELAEVLRKKYGIYVELAEERYCLIILGIVNDQRFLDKIREALAAIDGHIETRSLYTNKLNYELPAIPSAKIPIRKAFFLPKEKINIEDGLGRVAGDFFIKYPPGIPLLVPGEVITQSTLEILKNNVYQYKIEDGIYVVKE